MSSTEPKKTRLLGVRIKPSNEQAKYLPGRGPEFWMPPEDSSEMPLEAPTKSPDSKPQENKISDLAALDSVTTTAAKPS